VALSVLGLALAYLLGAIPVGYLVARVTAGLDIRGHGSGNVGATNVLRTLGVVPAAITLLGDAAKGWGAVWLAGGLGGPEPAWAAAGAVFAVIGHCWSVFLGFTGGKGVATGLGAFLGLAPLAAVLTLPVWVVIAAASRYVSLASMAAAGCLPFGVFLLGYPAASALAALAAAIVVVARHRENLVRLLAGNELKLGARLPGS
jgi:glycerol-3-phosphate acyltransferase PlsY